MIGRTVLADIVGRGEEGGLGGGHELLGLRRSEDGGRSERKGGGDGSDEHG